MTPKHIIWKEERYGILRGYVEHLYLFSISYNTIRPKNNDMSENFIVSTNLPQMKNQYAKTEEEAKAIAADMLASFTKKVVSE